MSVLIKGMEMPTEGYIDVRIKCNGTASFAIANNPYFKAVEAVPIPPHGRLIDADALIEKVIAKYLKHERKGELVFAAAEIKQDICDLISDAPTIIEAEEGERWQK